MSYSGKETAYPPNTDPESITQAYTEFYKHTAYLAEIILGTSEITQEDEIELAHIYFSHQHLVRACEYYAKPLRDSSPNTLIRAVTDVGELFVGLSISQRTKRERVRFFFPETDSAFPLPANFFQVTGYALDPAIKLPTYRPIEDGHTVELKTDDAIFVGSFVTGVRPDFRRPAEFSQAYTMPSPPVGYRLTEHEAAQFANIVTRAHIRL